MRSHYPSPKAKALIGLLGLPLATQALGAGICDTIPATMQPQSLWWAPPGCGNAGCLKRVYTEGSSTYLCTNQSQTDGKCLTHQPLDGRSGPYNFYYITKDWGKAINSVVVVQQYAVPEKEEERKGFAKVMLSRDGAEFACTNGREAYGTETTNVSFERYDDYHRSFLTPSNSDAIRLATEFHFRYQNRENNTCRKSALYGYVHYNGGVRTDDPTRRPLFLLYDRDNFYAPGWHTFYGRVVKPIVTSALETFVPGTAVADETRRAAMLRFAQFKVHMANYRAAAGSSGCFSFTVSTQTSGPAEERLPLKEVIVTLRDLEGLQPPSQHESEIYSPKQTWTFPIN